MDERAITVNAILGIDHARQVLEASGGLKSSGHRDLLEKVNYKLRALVENFDEGRED